MLPFCWIFVPKLFHHNFLAFRVGCIVEDTNCHDPLPAVILPVARVYRDAAEDTDKDKVNTFKLLKLI